MIDRGGFTVTQVACLATIFLPDTVPASTPRKPLRCRLSELGNAARLRRSHALRLSGLTAETVFEIASEETRRDRRNRGTGGDRHRNCFFRSATRVHASQRQVVCLMALDQQRLFVRSRRAINPVHCNKPQTMPASANTNQA